MLPFLLRKKVVGVDRRIGSPWCTKYPSSVWVPTVTRTGAGFTVTVGGFGSGSAGHDTSTTSGSVSIATEEVAVVSVLVNGNLLGSARVYDIRSVFTWLISKYSVT